MLCRMSEPTRFQRSVESPVSAHETFQWHVRPGALRRLLPPWDSAEVIDGSGPEERLSRGARTTIRVGPRIGGIKWLAEITELDEANTTFVDTQIKGPFRSWVHRHVVEGGPEPDRATLTDDIAYELPLGGLGRLFGGGLVRSKLTRMFAWRHRIMVHDLAAHARAAAAGFEGRTIAITGASGLVGSSLAAFLRTGGHRVLELVRREARAPHEVRWDPSGDGTDHAALEGIDVLVHLAGESIFGLRWTDDKKRRIVDSRVEGTRSVVNALAKLERPPRACIFASAIGLYGDRGDEVLEEDAAPGTGFLAETCQAWEAEAERLRDDVRGVRMRLGIVLDPGGGALKTMMPAFKAGLGGRLGSGEQWFPWVALDDVIGAMHFAMHANGLAGPVNLVAPEEHTNRSFTKTLGRVIRRPTILPAPAFAMRAALGAEQAEEMLLASVRVRPARLLEAGYPFARPGLERALKHASGRLV